MKKLFTLTNAAYLMLLGAVLLAFWFLLLGGYLAGEALKPDPEKAKQIQPFVSGLVLPLLTLGSTLLVIANLRSNTIQNFSSNFFKLIDQHHKLVDNLASAVTGITTEEKPSTKRDFFDDLANCMARDFQALSAGDTSSIDETLVTSAVGRNGKELLMTIYDHYFHIHLSDLGHYFRNLYHVIAFVERSSLNDKSRVTYVKMLRAQLSNYELLLLAYNGMHEYGSKFHLLIEKYELLKNLNNERRVPAGYEKRIVDTNILIESYPHLKVYWNEAQK